MQIYLLKQQHINGRQNQNRGSFNLSSRNFYIHHYIWPLCAYAERVCGHLLFLCFTSPDSLHMWLEVSDVILK